MNGRRCAEQFTDDDVGKAFEVEIEKVGHRVEWCHDRHRSRICSIRPLCMSDLAVCYDVDIVGIVPSVLLKKLHLMVPHSVRMDVSVMRAFRVKMVPRRISATWKNV